MLNSPSTIHFESQRKDDMDSELSQDVHHEASF